MCTGRPATALLLRDTRFRWTSLEYSPSFVVSKNGWRKPSLCLNGSQLAANADEDDPRSGLLVQLCRFKLNGRNGNAAPSALPHARKWLLRRGSAGLHNAKLQLSSLWRDSSLCAEVG